MANIEHQKPLKSIETLRFISAVMVVLAHFPQNLDIPILQYFLGDNLFLGSIGVDIFFIISGLVIGLSVKRSINEPSVGALKRFIYARILRIYPLYILITSVLILIFFYKDGYNFERDYLLKSLFLIPHLTDGAYQDPILSIGWTLQFEMFFYVTCFLALVTKIYALPIFLIIFLIAYGHYNPFYYSSSIMLEFLYGYIVAFYISRLQSFFAAHTSVIKALVVIATIIVLMAATGRDTLTNSNVALVPRMAIQFSDFQLPRYFIWGIPALLITLVTILTEKSFKHKFHWLGKYTYSLYLTHIIVLRVQEEILSPQAQPFTIIITYMLLQMVTCYLCYALIEQPIMKKYSQIRQPLHDN